MVNMINFRNIKNIKLKKIAAAILLCCILLPAVMSCKTGSGNNENNVNNNPGTAENNNITGASENDTENPDGSDGSSQTSTAAPPVSPANENSGANDIGYTAKQIVDAVIKEYSAGDLPSMIYYFSEADEDSENFLDLDMAGFIISGRFSEPPEFEYLKDFALNTPRGKNMFEVNVLRVNQNDIQHLDDVKKLLETRLKTKGNGDVLVYTPEDKPILDNAKVITIENYAILLATTDNSKAEAVINSMIKAGSSISVLENAENAENAKNTDNTENANAANANANAEDTKATESTTAANDKTDKVEETPTTTAAKVPEETTTASAVLEGVVNIEPEILFDFNVLNSATEATEAPKPENNADDAPAANAKVTALPRVRVHSYSMNTSYIIGGSCESGAKIKVTGGTEELFTGSDYGEFLVEVPFANTGTSILKLTAIVDGKQPSEEITFIVKPQKDVFLYEESGVFGVVVGYNYMNYFDDCLPDYLGTNLLSDKEITALQTRTEKRIQDLKDKGCKAEIIYLLVANPMRLYPEDVPKRYTEFKGDTLKRQWKDAVTKAGATVIDLTDVLMEHRNDEFKIFHKTDSHWTEYGAMFGYEELMKYIGKKFPDAAPRPRSAFEPYNIRANFGDIYKTLGLNLTDLYETSTFIKYNYKPPHVDSIYKDGCLDLYDGKSVCPVHARVSSPLTAHTDLPGSFPTAYIFRDSFAGQLHGFLMDRFSTAWWKGMWDYKFDIKDIANKNPDYIIYLISERNIKAVLYN